MGADLTPLLGLRCTGVRREPHSWHFAFDGGAALVAECPWRILVNGRVRLGSADDQQRFGCPEPVDAQMDARNLFGDRRVVTATVTPDGAISWCPSMGESGSTRSTVRAATRAAR
jgi:hypothetical protein